MFLVRIWHKCATNIIEQAKLGWVQIMANMTLPIALAYGILFMLLLPCSFFGQSALDSLNWALKGTIMGLDSSILFK